MKRQFHLPVAVAVVLGAGATALFPASEAASQLTHVTVGYGHVPPLSYRDEIKGPAGFAVEVLNEAARREGIALDWKRVAGSAQIEEALTRGTIDLMAAGMDTPERRAAFFVSRPWWFTELSIVVRADSGVRSADNLGDRRLALAAPAYKWLATRRFPHVSEVVPNDPRNDGAGAALHAVCQGEAGAALMAQADLQEWMLAGPEQCRGVALRAFETDALVELSIIARRDEEGIAGRLRNRIDELTADGTLVAIASRNPPISTQSATRLAADLRARYLRKTQTLWISSFAVFLLLSGAFTVKQVRTRKALARNEARYRGFFELAALGTAQVDAATRRFIDVNQAYCSITGYSREELLGGRTFREITHPDDRPGDAECFERLCRGEISEYSREKRYVRKDGETAWARIDVAGVPDAHGGNLYVVAITQDITARKHAEDALRKKAQIIELSHDAIIITDPNRIITDWNAGAEEMYGIPKQQALGRVTHELLKTTSTISAAEIDATLADGSQWDGELVHTRADGSQITVDSRHLLVKDGRGTPVAILEINRDISDRKRVEAALRASEQRFAAFMDHSPTIAWMKDEEGRHVYLSRSYENRFGVRLADWRGKTDFEVWPREVAERLRKADLEVLAGGGTVTVAEETVNGSCHHWLNVKFPFSDADGNRYVGGVGLDVTEQKHLEERLRQSQKLESIGALAAGAAHMYNNLLTVIMGHASMALSDCPECENVQSIATAAQKAADLTQQLLAYSGKGQFVLKDVPISKMVGDLAALLRPLVPRNIDLQTALPPDPYCVTADPSQIQQIVVNLATNAVEAVGEEHAGVVTLSNGVRNLVAPLETPFGFRIEPGAYAAITVSDTGCGMDKSTMDRIFDPFFTTKFKGRGLGLAAVAGVVRSLKGAILVESVPAQGSTFTVLLPAHMEECLRPETAPVIDPDKVRWTFQFTPGSASGKRKGSTSATVLVVDDEQAVREFIGSALRKAGYDVRFASDGAEGVAAVQSQRIDLAVVDVVMPGMLGGAAVAEMRRIQPRLKVLVTSGYTEQAAQQLSIETSDLAFIQKPYRAAQLVAKVKAVLETNLASVHDSPID